MKIEIYTNNDNKNNIDDINNNSYDTDGIYNNSNT